MKQYSFTFKDISNSRTKPVVAIDSLEIRPNQQWAVIGGNGSGKSTLAEMLTGKISLTSEQRLTTFNKIISVSFEHEQALFEREIYEDDSEFIDKVDQGRTTRELIEELLEPTISIEAIIDTLQLHSFLDTGFRLLSTGERRRMMIARALSQAPDMLVLDEPFDGLDVEFTKHMAQTVRKFSTQLCVVLIVNRLSQLTENITHLAFLHQMKLVLHGAASEVQNSPLWQQLQSQHSSQKPLPAELPNNKLEKFRPSEGQPIVELRQLNVAYHQKPIIQDLDWKVMPGQHWQVEGANGSGKSTLVNIVSGDHPQCYSNEIYLFGKKRGLGESIWDIKHHMGLMSTTLHQQYRVTINAETVLLSGFFDSIGVYRPVTETHKNIAREWLEFLGLEDHRNTIFQQLSFGQQRMLLIARALIKRPYLLILDEPCQGLDPINRALVIGLIEQIAERNIAQVIYISHEPEDHLDCITHKLSFLPTENFSNEVAPFEILQQKV